MKKILFWISLLALLLITPSLSWAVIPTPARIYGTVTVDGEAITSANDDGYSVVVTKENSTAYDPAAEDTDGFEAGYIIYIPKYDATDQPGGATTGETAKIHLYYGDVEQPISSPADGLITVGEDSSDTRIDIVSGLMTLTMAVAAIEGDTEVAGVGGTTDPAAGSHSYSYNQEVSVNAIPAIGYVFDHWIVNSVNFNNPASTSIRMDHNYTVTAVFSDCDYTLTMAVNDSQMGSTDPAVGDSAQACNSTVTVTATPAEGYSFNGWTGDVDYPYAATTTVTIDEDKTVTAVFDTDSDGDGKDDTSEQGPNGDDTSYDGDDDGTADSTQKNVVSTYNTDGTYYVTLSTDPAYTLSVQSIMIPYSPGPSSVTMDYGYFDINVSGLDAGGSAIVTIAYPAGVTAPDTYYKYGPTPDNTTPHWYEFLYDESTGTGAEFSGNTITLHYVDGLRGDSDLTANGTIDDPGGAGRVVVTTTPPTASTGGGGGGGGGGIFGEISIRDVLGYHFDGNTSDGIGVYMPVTNTYKALKGAQTHVEGFAPNFASFVRSGFDFLEQKAESNKDGILYSVGTHAFPVLGKIAEFYLDIVGAEKLKVDAYADTTISIKEFKALEQQGKAVAPHRVNFENEPDKAPIQK